MVLGVDGHGSWFGANQRERPMLPGAAIARPPRNGTERVDREDTDVR